MIKMQCPADPLVVHEFPDDWVFGGADGKHPGGDLRHVSCSYYYYDYKLALLMVTSAPTCDEVALSYIRHIEDRYGQKVEWVQVVRYKDRVRHLPETILSPLVTMQEQKEAVESGQHVAPTLEEQEELDRLGSSNA